MRLWPLAFLVGLALLVGASCCGAETVIEAWRSIASDFEATEVRSR